MDELIILALYLNVDGLSKNQADQHLQNVYNAYRKHYIDVKKDVKIHILPVLNQETRIECIYPISISSKDGKSENELLGLYKLIVNMALSNSGTNNEEIKTLVRNIERKLKLNKIRK